MDSAGNSRVRDVSKALFGGTYRLEVAAAIAAADGAFYGKALADEIELDYPLVHVELKKLEAAGLLTRLPKAPGEQARYLEPVSSAYWRLAMELVAEVRTADSIRSTRRS